MDVGAPSHWASIHQEADDLRSVTDLKTAGGQTCMTTQVLPPR